MHINCVICSDLFVPVSDVFATNCGHLFHYTCLIQWLERAKSCPQCRNKTTEKSIHRVYFNVATNEAEEDSSLLHNKIDSLKFQLCLKDTDIKNNQEENSKLNNQNKGLREEIVKLEKKIRIVESTSAAYKDQMRYLKAQQESAEAAVEEAKALRKQLDSMKSVQKIIHGSTADVEDILNKHGDSYDSMRSLATYVSVLKREVQAVSEKKRELRDRLKACQLELHDVHAQKEKLIQEVLAKTDLNRQIETDLKHVEEEKKSLQKKIRDLERAISSPNSKDPKSRALERLIFESPAPEAAKRPRLSDPTKTTSTLLTSNLPRPTSSSQYSIFKKTRTEIHSTKVKQHEEVYDGFGGHSKPDVFPVPSQKHIPVKKKRPTTYLDQIKLFKYQNLISTNKLLTVIDLKFIDWHEIQVKL
ncbi:hypothetical protein C0J52_09281 [Blattella germanica]|nr:hypothetical protein C0J52_09281 [Blattella germanica]